MYSSFDLDFDPDLDTDLDTDKVDFEIAKRIAFDDKFKSYFSPDTSKNAWYDKEYNSRYVNNPKVEQFLIDKAKLLQKRGDYIEKSASEGNIEPFIQHAKWLQKQGVLPSDTESFSSLNNKFANNYGLSSEQDIQPGSLVIHDIFSHSLPDKYLGRVDKSLPDRVTAADEARAVLIEEAASGNSVFYDFAGDPVYEFPIDKKSPLLKSFDYTLRLPATGEEANSYNDDVVSEVSTLGEEYTNAAFKESYTNKYGTKLDIDMDPKVSVDPDEVDKVNVIKKELLRAAVSRFPSKSPKNLLNTVNKAFGPYIQDATKADKLTLASRVYSSFPSSSPKGPEDYSNHLAKWSQFLDNARFSLDPVTGAAVGALELGRDLNNMSEDLTEWWNIGRNTRVPNESNASWGELLRDDRNQLTRTDAAFEAGETGLKGFRPLKAFTPRMIKTGPTPAVRQAFERPVRSIARNPASLLPGLADLIPSPEAIQTGYKQGPVAMGQQMGREFVQSLPTGAAFAAALSTPALAPFAPGIGAGLVGSAAVNAANEVVRQETGEGIVPKVRQFIGTAPRTNVAGKPRMAAAPLTAEIKPLSAQGKAEMNRRQNRNELEKRMDLVKERFNPRRGEFGLSELVFGR